MKKIRGFTLIELIVVMAIFGIIMTGLMNIMAPITEASNTQRVANNQNRVQSSMISYIGENLRYSYDLAVVEGGTMKNAVDKFIAMEPVDVNGKKINYTDHPELRDDIQIICFDDYSKYSVGDAGADFYGRILRSNNVYGPAGGFTYNNIPVSDYNSLAHCSPEGNKPLYLTLGTDYYSHADYFLSAEIVDDVIELTIDSDYYYSPTKVKMLSTEHDATDADDKLLMTTGRYELKNKGTGSFKFKMMDKNGTELTTPASTSRINVGDPDNCIYFVFLTKYVPNDGNIGLEYHYGGDSHNEGEHNNNTPSQRVTNGSGESYYPSYLQTSPDAGTKVVQVSNVAGLRDDLMGTGGAAFTLNDVNGNPMGTFYIQPLTPLDVNDFGTHKVYSGSSTSEYKITLVDSSGNVIGSCTGTPSSIQGNFGSQIGPLSSTHGLPISGCPFVFE